MLNQFLDSAELKRYWVKLHSVVGQVRANLHMQKHPQQKRIEGSPLSDVSPDRCFSFLPSGLFFTYYCFTDLIFVLTFLPVMRQNLLCRHDTNGNWFLPALVGLIFWLVQSHFLSERKKLWKWEDAISRIECQTPEKADTKEVMEAVPLNRWIHDKTPYTQCYSAPGQGPNGSETDISPVLRAFSRAGLNCAAMAECILSPMPAAAPSLWFSYLGCESHIFQQNRIYLTKNKKYREIVRLW